MSKRIEIVDELRSSSTDDILLQSTLAYRESKLWADYTNDELPSKVAILEVIGGGINTRLEIPFDTVTFFEIGDWQEDIPDGETQTYAELLGNKRPKPFVYVNNDVENGESKFDFGFNIVFNEDKTFILSVRFEFGLPQTGIIAL